MATDHVRSVFDNTVMPTNMRWSTPTPTLSGIPTTEPFHESSLGDDGIPWFGQVVIALVIIGFAVVLISVCAQTCAYCHVGDQRRDPHAVSTLPITFSTPSLPAYQPPISFETVHGQPYYCYQDAAIMHQALPPAINSSCKPIDRTSCTV